MQSLFHNFGVDWKLLLAQVVNFFILLYILKRFAYAPVVKMLRDRQERIKQGLEASAESERKLRSASERESEILKAAQAKALSVVGNAEESAFKREAEILEAAHNKAEQAAASALRRIEEEREKEMSEVMSEAENLVLRATAKVLGKMEPAERDALLVREALRELSVEAKRI
jgi:F-type H+-transporting ATPase subunit b